MRFLKKLETYRSNVFYFNELRKEIILTYLCSFFLGYEFGGVRLHIALIEREMLETQLFGHNLENRKTYGEMGTLDK